MYRAELSSAEHPFGALSINRTKTKIELLRTLIFTNSAFGISTKRQVSSFSGLSQI